MRCPRFVLAIWMLSLVGGCGAAPAATSRSPSVTSTAIPAAPPAPAAAGAGNAHASLKAPGEATVGDRTICPTSGEEFVVSADSPKYEYQGKTYYFCCGGCDAEFAKDPQKFLKKKPDT